MRYINDLPLFDVLVDEWENNISNVIYGHISHILYLLVGKARNNCLNIWSVYNRRIFKKVKVNYKVLTTLRLHEFKFDKKESLHIV